MQDEYGFRVTVDSLRDPDKFQILGVRVSCGAFDRHYLSDYLNESSQ